MEFLKTITGKIVTGLVGLAVVAGGISWWSADPSTRHMLISGSGKIMGWFGIVLILPWATFFLIRMAAQRDSNLAGAVLVMCYTIPELVLLAWLFNWHVPNTTAWVFLILGGLVAGVYNLLTCDWLAEKVA
jgi:hypothetical protein